MDIRDIHIAYDGASVPLKKLADLTVNVGPPIHTLLKLLDPYALTAVLAALARDGYEVKVPPRGQLRTGLLVYPKVEVKETAKHYDGELRLAYMRDDLLFVFGSNQKVVDFQQSSNMLNLQAEVVVNIEQGYVRKNPNGHTAHEEAATTIGDRLMLRHATEFEIRGGDEDSGFTVIVTRELAPENGWAILRDDGTEKRILVQRQVGSDSMFWVPWARGEGFDDDVWFMVNKMTVEGAFALAEDLADQKINPSESE